MQGLRASASAAVGLLRCTFQPRTLPAAWRAGSQLRLQGVRWITAKVSTKKTMPLKLALVTALAKSKPTFDESVDVALSLNVDPRKSDQALRGLAVLPHGTGSTLRVAVFATGAEAEAAKAAGAAHVGVEELIAEIKSGNIDFDRAVATPAEMPKLKAVARILGPKGLMPNAKLGTVTNDVAGAIAQLNKGAPYRVEKAGLIHAKIGKVSSQPSAPAFLRVVTERTLLSDVLRRGQAPGEPRGVHGPALLRAPKGASPLPPPLPGTDRARISPPPRTNTRPVLSLIVAIPLHCMENTAYCGKHL
jgi:large subunit ribosomal protein L1